MLQRAASNCARFHFNDPDYVSFGPITSIGCFERYVEHREEFGSGSGKSEERNAFDLVDDESQIRQ